MIAAWRQELYRILDVFNVSSVGSTRHSITTFFQTELGINTHTLVADSHRNALAAQEVAIGQHQSVSAAFYASPTRH